MLPFLAEFPNTAQCLVDSLGMLIAENLDGALTAAAWSKGW